MNTTKRIQRIEDTLISKYHIKKYINASPKKLIHALKQDFPNSEFESWDERIAWGGIYVNGIRTLENISLPCPCKIEYYEPKVLISEQKKRAPIFNSTNVLFEDDYIIIVFKPSGLSSQIAKEQKHISLYNYVKNYCGKEVHMPSRLDFSTSGVVVISKNKEMNKPLQQLFEKKEIQKYYLLETNITPEWQSKTINKKITRDNSHAVLRKTSATDGKDAVTNFTHIENSKYKDVNTAILMAEPKTGRTHQIRVHTTELGGSIIGDNFYEGVESENLHLLSYRVAFKHPISDKMVDITLPKEMLPYWAQVAIK